MQTKTKGASTPGEWQAIAFTHDIPGFHIPHSFYRKKQLVNPIPPLQREKLSSKSPLSENRTLAFWGREVWRVLGGRGVRNGE